jgi:predicted lipoprotein with Yx(FWY)xxD motif
LLAAATAGAADRLTLRVADNPTVRRLIVVDERGRTLYRLTTETFTRLLCTGSCTRTWLPVTVASRRTELVAGPGVAGRLALVRRPGGRLQVTLRGHPLYRFAGDRAAGQANGRGLRSGGALWQVVLARAPKLPPDPPPI